MLQSIPISSHAVSTAEGQTEQHHGLVRHMFSFLSYCCNRLGSIRWQGNQTCPTESVADELKHWHIGALR